MSARAATKIAIDFSDQSGSFEVRVCEPEEYEETIFVVGGLHEHYSFMAEPVLRTLSEAGFRAVGVSVPYERHLESTADIADFINRVVCETRHALVVDEEKPLLLLHSGAVILVSSSAFTPASYEQIVLWSSLGLQRPNRHPSGSFFAVWQLLRHSAQVAWSGLTDWRAGIASLSGIYSVMRNIRHMSGVLGLIYGQSIRREVDKIPGIIVVHGANDRLYPLDGKDQQWLREHDSRLHMFEASYWRHVTLFSRNAIRQAHDIATLLRKRD